MTSDSNSDFNTYLEEGKALGVQSLERCLITGRLFPSRFIIIIIMAFSKKVTLQHFSSPQKFYSLCRKKSCNHSWLKCDACLVCYHGDCLFQQKKLFKSTGSKPSKEATDQTGTTFKNGVKYQVNMSDIYRTMSCCGHQIAAGHSYFCTFCRTVLEFWQAGQWRQSPASCGAALVQGCRNTLARSPEAGRKASGRVKS
jgi:hypothetical protein